MQERTEAELTLEKDKAMGLVEKLQQRMADLFGPEAAQLDASKAEAVQARKGDTPALFSGHKTPDPPLMRAW